MQGYDHEIDESYPEDDESYVEDDYVEVGGECGAPLLQSQTIEEIHTKMQQNAKMWSVSGDAYFPCDYTTEQLPPGYYTVEKCQTRGVYFNKNPMNLDDLIVLPDSSSEMILNHIKYFWTREKKFRELGFLWKRGILLHGPAGGGKTSTLQLLSKMIIDLGGLSIYLKVPHLTAKGLEILRRIEPTRPIIVLIEDIDAVIKTFGESEILAVLDGELQIDNVVFIATTNYPEELDKRLKNRPSRFDLVQKIGMPSAEARQIYLTAKNPRLAKPGNEKELFYWVEKSKGFSVAHLKEMILAVEALDEDLEHVISRLKHMIAHSPKSSDNDGNKVGFIQND